MSTVITPIPDISESQKILIEEDQERTLLAKLAAQADDRVDRTQSDAAALAIRVAQVRSQDEALNNVKDALNATAATGVAIRNATEILSRLKDLALQLTSNALDGSQRQTIQSESDVLKIELTRLANNAEADRTASQAQSATAATANRTLTPVNTTAPTSAPRSVAAGDSGDTVTALKTSDISHDIILEQTSASVLAQANQDPQVALNLLEED